MMHSMLWPMIAPGALVLAVLTLAGAALVRYLFFTTPAIVPMPINEITHFAGAPEPPVPMEHGAHRAHLTDDR